MLDLGSKLKQLRADKPVMQKDIASLLEVSVRTYQYYEKNELEPNLTNIIKLCNYFNVSADYLLGLSDDPTRR